MPQEFDNTNFELKNNRQQNLSQKKLEKERNLEMKVKKLEDDLVTINNNPMLNTDDERAIIGKKNVELALSETKMKLKDMIEKHDQGYFKFYANKIRNTIKNLFNKQDTKSLNPSNYDVQKDAVNNSNVDKYAKEEAVLSEDNPHVQNVGDYVKENVKQDINEFLDTLKGKTNPPEVVNKSEEERERVEHSKNDISKNDDMYI